MKIVDQSIKIIDDINGINILKKIEVIGRVAYKSEDKITGDSYINFIKKIIINNHLAVIEHVSISVHITTDRAIANELVRHRIASYTQESTRFCNYNKDKFNNEIIFIDQGFKFECCDIWKDYLFNCEEKYMSLIRYGIKPQIARSVLPLCLKTEIVATMNLRQWLHFFKLRTSPNAHPLMIELAKMILFRFKKEIPIIFDEVL